MTDTEKKALQEQQNQLDHLYKYVEFYLEDFSNYEDILEHINNKSEEIRWLLEGRWTTKNDV